MGTECCNSCRPFQGKLHTSSNICELATLVAGSRHRCSSQLAHGIEDIPQVPIGSRGNQLGAGSSPASALWPWRSHVEQYTVAVVLTVISLAGHVSGTKTTTAYICFVQTCNGRPGCTLEHWEVSITTLLAQLSYAYLALDAIHEENAFQLVTSTGLSVVAALLWVLFAVSAAPKSASGDLLLCRQFPAVTDTT